MDTENTRITAVEPVARGMDANEAALGIEVSQVEQAAISIIVANEADYLAAAEACKTVKTTQKHVEEYWNPLWRTTYDAYKNVQKHKDEMLTPLKNAEKILKGKMSAYQMQVAEERKRQEEAIRAAQKAESDRRLQASIDAENAGDMETAEAELAQAEIFDIASETSTVSANAPKASGTSVVKSWKITSIDSDKVPVSLGGVEIRPVDEGAVMRLIKASKGKVSIPGITYTETRDIRIKT